MQANDIFRHFKGKEYRILGISYCADGDHLIPRVEFSDLETGVRYSHSLSTFLEVVDRPEFKHHGPRFVFERKS